MPLFQQNASRLVTYETLFRQVRFICVKHLCVSTVLVRSTYTTTYLYGLRIPFGSNIFLTCFIISILVCDLE